MTQLCELPEKRKMPIIPFIMNVLDIDMLIGKNLKRIREKRGLSQAQLAEKIGTTPQRLSAYETGRDGMGKDYMERVCKALKVEPWEFYWTETTPIVAAPDEQQKLYLFREEKRLGVAEDVSKYEAYRIEEAKKKDSTVAEGAPRGIQRGARKR